MKQFYNNKSQLIGVLSDKGNFKKKVDSRKHKMKIYNAYGIDERVVNKLKEYGCLNIGIFEMDTNTFFTTDFSNFLNNSFVKDHGEGKQAFLELKYWNSNHDKFNSKEKPLISQNKLFD